MADPRDTKPRKPPRRPDGVALPRSAEDDHSTRVRVGHYVPEPVQRLTVHSATPLPGHADFQTNETELTAVDPMQRRLFEGEFTSPEHTHTDPEGPTGQHLSPILPPVEESLLPGSFDEDLFDGEEWDSEHSGPSGSIGTESDVPDVPDVDDVDDVPDADDFPGRGSTLSSELETTQNSIPGILDYENIETSRHRLDLEAPLLPPAPVPSFRAPLIGPATRVARPIPPPAARVAQPTPIPPASRVAQPAPSPAARLPEPEPEPRSLALPPPPVIPALAARPRAEAPAAVDSPASAVPTEMRDLGTDGTQAPAPSELRGPLVGGRYRVLERIGAGGMGKVFKVVHQTLGKTFALKIIRDSMAGQNKARDLFYREARLASSVSHPNIASVVDFGEDEKLGAFMVMEFLQGEPLAKLLKREKRLSLRQAIDMIQQVAEALHYIHGKGIVHCDIKTENILLTEVPDSKRRKLQVKLLDFGLARSTTTTRNTNSLAGTPHYVAPERIRGQKASPSSDIYGLGILFYELLTGRVPWDGSVDEILSGHLNQQPVPPSRLLEGGLDPAVEKLILHALAKTPEKRHKNIAAFLYELHTVMDMLGYGKRRSGARRVVRPPNQRDEAARALFDACRVPMALLDRAGTILVANAAFAQFVMGITVEIEGRTVAGTPLARVWSTFASDLARACGGSSLRRTVQIQLDSGEIRRLMLWLDPGLNSDQAIFGVHSLDG
ncbi:MAG TPA: protein kinase [Haliangium sp.]|nr:protein kinase [Haliangium sp.]